MMYEYSSTYCTPSDDDDGDVIQGYDSVVVPNKKRDGIMEPTKSQGNTKSWTHIDFLLEAVKT